MRTSALIGPAIAALLGFLLLDHFTGAATPASPQQESAAVALSEQWMFLIDSVVQARGLPVTSGLSTRHTGVIGEEYSLVTTTLGALEAKELSTNPGFAALILRSITESGIPRGSTVGVTLSGSFPALSISTMAALKTAGMNAILISSLGASSYGANRPGLMWIDMESILHRHGMPYRSACVTLGAEGDSGDGLFENGKELLLAAAERNHAPLFIPRDFPEAVQHRLHLFDSAKIALLINIGGSQAVMGSCPHGESLPNGLQRSLPSCADSGRGLLVRIAEHGIPVLHLLNIRSLGAPVGLVSPTSSLSHDSFAAPTSSKISAGLLLAGILVSVFLLRRK